MWLEWRRDLTIPIEREGQGVCGVCMCRVRLESKPEETGTEAGRGHGRRRGTAWWETSVRGPGESEEAAEPRCSVDGGGDHVSDSLVAGPPLLSLCLWLLASICFILKGRGYFQGRAFIFVLSLFPSLQVEKLPVRT